MHAQKFLVDEIGVLLSWRRLHAWGPRARRKSKNRRAAKNEMKSLLDTERKQSTVQSPKLSRGERFTVFRIDRAYPLTMGNAS